MLKNLGVAWFVFMISLEIHHIASSINNYSNPGYCFLNPIDEERRQIGKIFLLLGSLGSINYLVACYEGFIPFLIFVMLCLAYLHFFCIFLSFPLRSNLKKELVLNFLSMGLFGYFTLYGVYYNTDLAEEFRFYN
jgi:hypothetical protein